MAKNNNLFMRADEVAEEMGVSKAFAYKVIQRLNDELRKKGCITICGRIDRKYFHDQIYGTRNLTNNNQKE